MRALVISDIHGNLAALNAVLEQAVDFEAIWCLGDIVGYGPNPNECIQKLLEYPKFQSVLGNHDAAAIDLMDTTSFNSEAQLAINWTKRQLTKASLDFLNQLPEMIEVDEKVTITHGSPRYPIFEYLLDTRSATENFDYFDTDYCLVGHSHLPLLYEYLPDDYIARIRFPKYHQELPLSPRAILNPGSVGQPRDRDPRAAFAIYDTDTISWEFCRVQYEITKTQKMMLELGLPESHADRLAGGW
ncbi:MAG: metallophosphoesterase family protein [Anaerolineales bacterium]|nr:metallophosphoesterase family protein [Anaerolineales bacterium]